MTLRLLFTQDGFLAGINWLMRKAALAPTSYVQILVNGDVITWKWKILFNIGSHDFPMGQPIDEVTPDGRHVKVKYVLTNSVIIES